MKSFFTALALPLFVSAFKWLPERADTQAASVCPRYSSQLEHNAFYHEFIKRQTGSVGGGGVDAGGSVGVGNVSATTGPISAGIGNINMSVYLS